MKIHGTVLGLVIVILSTKDVRCATLEELLTALAPKNTTGLEEVETIEVSTPFGTIKGKKGITDDDVEIDTFLGIPYAQPPVGNLRFLPPQPMLGGYDNYEAFQYGAICPQANLDFEADEKFTGNEDCLYLNIFSKSQDANATNRMLKPVMVWIHGGGFVLGSGSDYDPLPLVLDDVLAVTINYRLGAFGFLTFGNDVVSGNNGLRDQIHALKWLKMMVAYFGGDPNRMTIFGESAGGISAHALTLSPKAAGLMSGAIYESGTMLFSREDYSVSKLYRSSSAMARYFNCSSSETYDYNMLACLQALPGNDILEITQTGLPDNEPEGELKNMQISWTPNIDTYSRDPVLPMDHLTAMKTGHFNRVPIMTGVMLNDGGLAFPQQDFGSIWASQGPEWLIINPTFFREKRDEETLLQSRLIRKFYTGSNDNSSLNDVLPDFADMLTDAYFLAPDQKLAQLASQYVPVYNFRFDYAGSHSFLPWYTIGREDLDAEALDRLKPVHSDEIFYLFNMLDLETESDISVRNMMVKYWTNFAKYSHPSPLMSDNLTQWLPYGQEKNTMILDEEPRMEKNIARDRMEFWQRIHWNQKESKIMEANIFQKAFQTVMFYMRGY
eukprot:TRINITY_DN5749_c0_g1_i2.p1 TRINITY_DN5749_c0_g1~~TRINITY_DN5749_c0_g1_i2.p1  ORF type:complete len:611 (-),score=135.22 TRINITY_DN5749_c0_g1_i2:452-2284(-)